MRGRGRVWLVVLVIALVVPAVSQAQSLGQVVIAQPADFVHMDPQRTILSTEISMQKSIFDPLIERGPSMRFVPALATAWRAVTPKEWVFTLRRGVKFHNGEPFNAEVVRWNVERITRPGFQDIAWMAPISRAEVIDEYTVKIITKDPAPFFEALISNGLQIVPPKYITEVGVEGFTRRPIGTGPYKFVERVRGSHLVVEANTDYWGGVPAVRAVIWRVIPEASTRVAALRAGEIDIAPQLPPDLVEQVNAVRNLRVESVRSFRTVFLHFFPESPQGGGQPLADKRVRQAVNYAINIDAIIKGVLAGHGTRIATLMTPDIFGFSTLVRPYPYDPDRAKRLLTEAGFPNGFELRFGTWTPGGPAPRPVEVAQAVAADLGKVGIRLRVEAYELGTTRNMMFQKTLPPLHLWSMAGSFLDCDEKFWGFFHPASPKTYLTTPEIVKLIDEERSIVDPRRRAEICARLQQLVADEAFLVPMFAQHDLYGVNERVVWKARPDEYVLPADMRLRGR